MQWIDSHAHLTSGFSEGEVEGLIARARQVGIAAIVNICTDPLSLQRGLELSLLHNNVFNTAATTPHDVEKEGESAFPIIAQAAREKKLVAVGETGLDYHYFHSPKETQKKYLRRYLQLALECSLPVVIHCRDAFADFFEIIDQEYTIQGRHASGVLHCFTGTIAEAEEVIKRGWYLSLSGIVTFKKSQVLQQVAKFVPLEQLLIETDAPYLAPQSRRGKTNESSYLPEIAACIANIKGITEQDVARATFSNTCKVFNLFPNFDNKA